jgi:hypothetical protein
MPERATVSSRSEKSAEAVVVGGKAAKPTRRRRAERGGVFEAMPMWRALLRCLRKQGGSRKGTVKPCPTRAATKLAARGIDRRAQGHHDTSTS